MRRIVFLAAMIVAVILASSTVSAQSPTAMNYQGRLLLQAGQTPVDGTADLVFSIWTGPHTDGSATQLWTETWNGVTVTNGIFSVLLGSNGTPLDPADFSSDASVYLQLEIDGETLEPRQQIGASPFAMVDEPMNELQDLSLTDSTISLSGSSAVVNLEAAVIIQEFQSIIQEYQTRLAELESLNPRVAFLTSTVFAGESIGGLAAADAECQSLADGQGIEGTFMAWLGDTTGAPSSRFIQSTFPYDRVDGVRIADNWSDLRDGTLQAPLNVTESGVTISEPLGIPVWTGSLANGNAWRPATYSCSDWSSPAGNGMNGNAMRTTALWSENGLNDCGLSFHLYCFEQ